MTQEHLINVVSKAYMAPDFRTVYQGRWDTWLITNGHIDEFVMLMLKSSAQLDTIISRAKDRAEKIKASPLSKALELIL